MRYNRRQTILILAGASLILAMLVIVPALTRRSDPLLGYLGVLLIYWICFCLPMAWLFGRGPTTVSIRPNLEKQWIPVAAIALPLIVFFGAGTLSVIGADLWLIVVALACALINGPLEELAWRRSFRANSNGRISFELIGLGLFTLWHLPLNLSAGIAFDHGVVGLVGGAFLLGVTWMLMTRASNSVGWPVVSHALVNGVAFLPFFASNFG